VDCHSLVGSSPLASLGDRLPLQSHTPASRELRPSGDVIADHDAKRAV
jgi:hypothetical protein